MTIVTHVHLKEEVADKPLVARVPKDGRVQLKVACRKKEIKGGNPAIAGNNEVSPGVSWCLTRATRYPSDPPAVARFLGLGHWLIPKVKVGSPDLARDAVDLVAATIDSLTGVVEHAIFGVELLNGRAPARGVVFTEDFLKIPSQQGRYAV